jgi:hypothetical protein
VWACCIGVSDRGLRAVMDLAVGEDRCAIWPCEDDKTLSERVREKTSCGEHTTVRLCRFLVLQLWIKTEQAVDWGKVSLGGKTVTKDGGASV